MKRSLLLLVVICLGQLLLAEVFQMGTDDITQNLLPFNCAINYGWTKTLLKAAELEAAGLEGETIISGIGFSIQEQPRYWIWPHHRVFLRHVTYDSYTDSRLKPDSTNATLVYSGALLVHAKGWQQLTFSQSFSWNGTDNLEILWKNHSGVSQSPSYKFDSYNSANGEYLSVYKIKDDEFPFTDGQTLSKRPILQLITPMKPEAALPIYPLDGSPFIEDSALRWKSGGGCPDSYTVYFGTQNPPPLLIPAQSEPFFEPVVEPGTCYFWKVVPSNESGSPNTVPVWSFHTPASDALIESFEGSSFPPSGWGAVPTGSWGRAEKYPYHGEKYAQAVSVAENVHKMLFTPLLYIDGNTPLEFCVQTSNQTTEPMLQIKYSSDAETWHNLGEPMSVEHDYWQYITVDLSALAGQTKHLGFEVFNSAIQGNLNLQLDHVTGPRLAGLYEVPALRISRNAGGLLLEWDEVPGAQGYRLYESTDPCNLGTNILNLGAGSLSHQVELGARGFFRVTALF
ncbi:MAG: hypothetical protein GX135_05260 [Candidatus Cloacimonetes bacterium]|nr:hypothetical protein [Candidatus Cloacimonadota bacterium]